MSRACIILFLLQALGCGDDGAAADGGLPPTDGALPRDGAPPPRDGAPPVDAGLPPAGAFEWTPLAPGADSVVVYLSSSEGDDGNDCLSEATACASLMRGESLVRDGEPDWLVLKRGDTWGESFSVDWSFGWRKSGRSADAPMVVGAYGDGPRPILEAGREHGFLRLGSGNMHDLAVVDLHFRAHTKDPTSADYVGPDAREFQSGFRFTGGGAERILVEGCLFEYFGSNFAMHPGGGDPPFRDVRVRGNVFYSAWTGDVSRYSQGIFVDGIHGLLIEGNVFDHNGGLLAYTDDPDAIVPPGLTERDVAVTWFNHQAYIQSDNREVVVRNNIFANGDGMQLRPGGIAEDNLFTRTINALTIGSATVPVPGGVTATLRDNVFLEGTDFAPQSDTPGVRANGILIANVDAAAGVVVTGNLFVRDASADRYGRAIGVNGQMCSGVPCPVHDAEIRANVVHEWRGGFSFNGALGPEIGDITVHDNVLHNPSDDMAMLLDFRSGYDASQFDFSGNHYQRGGAARWIRTDSDSYDFDGWIAYSGESGASSGPAGFADPDRSLESYNGMHGGAATHADFMARARQQRRDAYDPAYEAATVNAWLREGFERR